MAHFPSPRPHPPEPRLYAGPDSLLNSKASNSCLIYVLFIFPLTVIPIQLLLLHPLVCFWLVGFLLVLLFYGNYSWVFHLLSQNSSPHFANDEVGSS